MDRPMRVYGLNVVEQFLDDLLVAVGALLVALGIAAAVFEDAFASGGLGGGMLVAGTAAAGILLAAGGSGIRQNRVASELGYALLAVAATGWIVSGAVAPSAVALATGLVLALVLVAAVALRRRALRLRFKPRFFSLRQFSTLIEVADAMIDGDGREALDPIEVAVRTDHLIARVETPVKKDLKLVLVLVEWLLPLMILRPFPFSVLGTNERRRAVDKVINAKGPFRDVARSLKVLACAGYYGSAEALAEVGFVRFEDRPRFEGVDTTPLAHPDPFPRNGHGPPERAHAVVIGSGAAGSVMACELTRAGLDVTVLEAGRHQNPQTFQHSEVEMFVRSYKAGGLQTTSDHHMLIVQGATVGGSTVINNAIWLEADLDRVLPEWAARGAHVPEDALRAAYRELRDALHVEDLPEEIANRGASVFDDGRRALGMEGGFLQHNRERCIGCGWCNYGCRYDRKTSMLVTYLPWALARGAKLHDRCRDVRIQADRGVARSVRFVRNGREQVVRSRPRGGVRGSDRVERGAAAQRHRPGRPRREGAPRARRRLRDRGDRAGDRRVRRHRALLHRRRRRGLRDRELLRSAARLLAAARRLVPLALQPDAPLPPLRGRRRDGRARIRSAGASHSTARAAPRSRCPSATTSSSC